MKAEYRGRICLTTEGEDLKGGEIRRQELVLLEILGPRKLRNQGRRGLNEVAKRTGSLD